MNTEYIETRDRLNRAMLKLRVRSMARREIQETIKLAKENQYKCMQGELNPSCKIPIAVGVDGQIIHCGSSTTQASHSIQRPLLVSLSDPGPGPDGQEPPNSSVLEVFPKDPEYWQDLALKHEWLWNIDRVRPAPKRPRGASTRPFACNAHDSKTFECIEGGAQVQFPAHRVPLTFSSSNCGGLDELEEQLFRVAYRAVLFHQDVLNSLKESLSLLTGMNERNRTRRDLRTRLSRSRSVAIDPVRSVVEDVKLEYDARILGVRPLGLTHCLIPIQTDAAATASNVFVEQSATGAFGHMTLTLFPSDVADREHWLILSYREEDDEWMSGIAHQFQTEVEKSQTSDSARVDWLVWLLRNSTNAYVKPSHYCGLSEEARVRIEERLVEAIIESSVEWVTELERLVKHPTPRHMGRPWRNRGRRHKRS